MTDLDRYRNAYSTMLGQVDAMITSLEGVRDLYNSMSPDMPLDDSPAALAALQRRAFIESMIMGLTKIIRDAEEVFMKPDPQEELRAMGLKEGYILVDDD